MKRFITLNPDNEVTQTRWGISPVEQEVHYQGGILMVLEIESELGEVRQIKQPDGSFMDKVLTDLEIQQQTYPKERKYLLDGIIDTQQFLAMTGEVFIEE